MARPILLIDTSERPQPDLSSQLLQCGFMVQVTREPQAAADLLQVEPDLLVLLRPRAQSAPEECARLREFFSGLLVVFLDEADEALTIRCLQAGADSVLSAPLARRELNARVRALLEQDSRLRPPERHQGASQIGDLFIDSETHAVTKGGRSLSLTPTEFRLLAALARRAGDTVPHEELISDVWGAGHADNVEHLRLYVRYLRQKLEDDHRRPRLLLNQRGVGYRLAVDANIQGRMHIEA